MANSSSTRMLLVTANIASCFEQPDTMLKPWITEFLKTVEEHDPHFIALHCQEVGGKNYEESMQHVEHFIRSLLNRGTMLPYNKIRVYLDEEYESAEKFTCHGKSLAQRFGLSEHYSTFTNSSVVVFSGCAIHSPVALGNLYFIHQNVQDLQIWDFEEMKFTDCLDRREYSGNIEDVSTKEKSKFPQEFFPEFPSVYSLNRKRALEHTLDRFHNDSFENVPIFLFGDFNFRLNTQAAVQKLTQGCTVVDTELPDSGEKAQEFRDNKGKAQLTISKKSFKHFDHQNIFLKDNGSWLHEFDQELTQFSDRLTEFPVSFPPSYPFIEGADVKLHVLFYIFQSGGKVTYNLIGLNTTMGDHKPVSLCVEVPMGAGIVPCCSPHAPCRNFVHEPDAQCFMQAGWCLCQSYPPCPRPVVTSVCPSTLSSLPGQVIPITPAAACVTPVRVDVAPAQGSVSSRGPCLVPQCVCSAGVSEEKISHHCHCGYPNRGPQRRTEVGVQSGDLLRNLLLLGGTSAGGADVNGHEQLLKRVNSAPNTSFVPPRPHCHVPLASSHSLDTGRCMHHTYPPSARLRLRASSSRLLSHHSSSTEEWFEEIPVPQDSEHDKQVSSLQFYSEPLKSPQEVSPPSTPKLCDSGDKPPPSPVSGVYQDMESGESVGACSMGESGGADSRGECHSTKESLGMVHKQLSTEQHSLNNLLLADSCDQLSAKHLTHSESSLSVHYSEDSVSSVGRPLKDGETVSQAPTFDIADVDPSDVNAPKPHIKCQKPCHKPNADLSERPPGQCCCVVS
ncbi:Inositol polyphosphate-5-phosphatase A-like [Homarus americanus]|uniref:inositol-polyphosphate 5-phosphatase n=1 Tax=Homarus americanus TaxID=6706 RepID=A0A8J5T9X0_HOMAM|nr:Inositol polyphosphate-5-phosphatase A-like [Homarus americanus]